MAASETHYTLPAPKFDKPVKLLIVVAPYYRDIADNLVAGAKAKAASVGAELWKSPLPSPWRDAWPILTAMSPLAASFGGRRRITTRCATTAAVA